MDNILTRRSIRKFRSNNVSDEDIKKILRAAMSAPSASNRQPWDFIIIKDRKTLDAIPEFHPYTKMAREASVAIVVCGNTNRADDREFWVQDCAAATQNILLAANSLGLGSVWCGVYPVKDLTEKFQKLLNLPPEIYPVSFIPIGYPNEEKPPSDRFDENKIHYEKW
jgi:nitroreductase